MPDIHINTEACKGCALCIQFCPKKKIALGKKLNKRGVLPAVSLKESTCTGCGFCALICPDCCIIVSK